MKRMPTKRLLAALSVSTALIAAPASAQILSDWDTDENGLLTEREFVNGAQEEGFFQDLDFDEDGVIDQTEFIQGMYQLWDRNGNGVLSVSEWDRGFDTWFGENTVNLDVEAWDPNGDDRITQTDFNRGMRQLGVFRAIEANADPDNLIGGQAMTRQAMQQDRDRSDRGQRQAQRDMRQRDRGNEGVGVVSLDDWDYENLRGGFSGENLLQAEVIGRNGAEIGDVEDIILTADNAIQTLIIEVGDEFLDIGGTKLAVPWDQVRVRMTGENVDDILVPISEGNYDRFSALGAFGYGAAEDEVALGDRTERVYRVENDVQTRGGRWKASNLMDDYVTFGGDIAYGYVEDMIFDEMGVLQSVVVQPDYRYDAGPYAYPFYGTAYGFDPTLDYYDLPYTYGDIGVLDPWDYGILDPGI